MNYININNKNDSILVRWDHDKLFIPNIELLAEWLIDQVKTNNVNYIDFVNNFRIICDKENSELEFSNNFSGSEEDQKLIDKLKNEFDRLKKIWFFYA